MVRAAGRGRRLQFLARSLDGPLVACHRRLSLCAFWNRRNVLYQQRSRLRHGLARGAVVTCRRHCSAGYCIGQFYASSLPTFSPQPRLHRQRQDTDKLGWPWHSRNSCPTVLAWMCLKLHLKATWKACFYIATALLTSGLSAEHRRVTGPLLLGTQV